MTYQAITPSTGNWIEVAHGCPPDDLVLDRKAFVSPLGVLVITSVDLIDAKPEHHLSMSLSGERIPASVVPVILSHFNAVDFEEDNHRGGGVVRHFWKPLTSDKPLICPCKDNEKPIEDGDFTWREK